MAPKTRSLALSTLAAALALSLGSAAPAFASHSDAHFVVVSGEQDVHDGAQVCFEVEHVSGSMVLLRARVQFEGKVPHGRLLLDEGQSPHFDAVNEEFSFAVDPSGVHRLGLRLEEPGRIDWLSLSVPVGEISQRPCRAYAPRQAQAEVERGLSVINQFENDDEWLRGEDGGDWNQTLPPVGTELTLLLSQGLTTRTAYAGQDVRATLAEDLADENGRLLLSKGSRVQGRVVESRDAGRFGRSLLRLQFDRIEIPGDRDLIIDSEVRRVGPGSGGKQAGIIAGSALGGALLGKVLGGDDEDALIGAVLGGGIAAGSIGAERNESVVLPEGTLIVIELDSRARLAQ